MAIKKLLLLWPYQEQLKVKDERENYSFQTKFPLGVGYLTAFMEEKGFEVDVIDCQAEGSVQQMENNITRWGLSDDEIRERIKESNPDLIGISQMFSYLEPICLNIFKIAQEECPDAVRVWGGTHPTVLPERCLKFPEVDFIVLGEGERPLLELVNRINNNESHEGAKSLGYRDSNGEIKFNNNRAWVEDLDTLPMPARHRFDMTRYYGWVHEESRVFTMVTCRGCPFACTYCSAPNFYQKRFLGRSPEKVVDEMEFLIKEYKAEKIITLDENLTADMKRMEKILDLMIERNVKIKWFAESGLTISRLNEPMLKKMKQTGFTELRLALESGDPEILKIMKKPLVLRKAKEVMGLARKHNFRITAFLLLGMPGESFDQMNRTVEYANELGFDWSFLSFVQPVPGAQIYKDLESRGIDVDFMEMIRYASPAKDTTDLSSTELVDFREWANSYLNFENNYNLRNNYFERALKEFERVTRSAPEIEKGWFYLGITYMKLNRLKDAKNCFNKVISINPKYQDVSGRLSHVETLMNPRTEIQKQN